MSRRSSVSRSSPPCCMPSFDAQVLLWLALILIAAKAGGDLASRIGQPAVLGELVAGVVIGNLGLVGITAFQPMAADPSLELLAKIGVLLLLFEVGLESTVSEMLQGGRVVAPGRVARRGGALRARLGRRRVAAARVTAPTCTPSSAPRSPRPASASRRGCSRTWARAQTPEARVILGRRRHRRRARARDPGGGDRARSPPPTRARRLRSAPSVARPLGKSVVFLVGALVLGRCSRGGCSAGGAPALARGAARVRARASASLLSWLAAGWGSRPSSGAFAAGLHPGGRALPATSSNRGEHELEDLVQPISSFLVAGLLRADGHADGPVGASLEPEVLALGGAADRGGGRRQAGVLAGRARPRHRPPVASASA